jgi:hypothetical protein
MTNASGKILGGSSTYPELIPPSGETLVGVDHLYTDVKPNDCVGMWTHGCDSHGTDRGPLDSRSHGVFMCASESGRPIGCA